LTIVSRRVGLRDRHNGAARRAAGAGGSNTRFARQGNAVIVLECLSRARCHSKFSAMISSRSNFRQFAAPA